MEDKVFEGNKEYVPDYKKSALYISDDVMSIDAINMDSKKANIKLNLSLIIHSILLVIASVELMFLTSAYWLYSEPDNDINFYTVFTAAAIPFALLIVLDSICKDEFHTGTRDITSVANRINEYFVDEEKRFDFSAAPLFFIESVASIYKPPRVAESEKMIVRKNGLLVLVVLPLVCALIPPFAAYLQSDAKDVMGRMSEAFSNQPNNLFIGIIIIVVFGLIIRVLYLPTSYLKRSLMYKYIVCAYPFIISELERRYSCK